MNRLAGVLLALHLLSTPVFAFQNCGGTERWAVKDGTDPAATSIDLTNITPIDVANLLSLHQPHLPSDNRTRIVPDETHVFKISARLVKWKHEANDDDYHLVLTDDTESFTDEHAGIAPTGHSFIGEVPNPDCTAGRDGSFGTQTPFISGIKTTRRTMDQRFPNANHAGGWNDGHGVQVEVTGIGFFDRSHQQTGRAPNNIEIHPILAIHFLDQPTPPIPPEPNPTPSPNPTGQKWEYKLTSADTAEHLLSNASDLGTQGWELVSVALDPARPDKYVGYLKRPATH